MVDVLLETFEVRRIPGEVNAELALPSEIADVQAESVNSVTVETLVTDPRILGRRLLLGEVGLLDASVTTGDTVSNTNAPLAPYVVLFAASFNSTQTL